MDLGGRKSKCGPDCTLFWRLQGDSTSLFFPPSRSFLHFLTGGPVLHLQIQQHQVKPASHCSLSDLLSYLPRPLLRTLLRTLVPTRSSRTLSPSQGQMMSSHNSICSLHSPFLCKVTRSQVLCIRTWSSFVGPIMLPTTNTIRQK